MNGTIEAGNEWVKMAEKPEDDEKSPLTMALEKVLQMLNDSRVLINWIKEYLAGPYPLRVFGGLSPMAGKPSPITRKPPSLLLSLSTSHQPSQMGQPHELKES